VWLAIGLLATFYGNIVSLTENIAKSLGGGYFFDSHCRLEVGLEPVIASKRSGKRGPYRPT